MKRQKQTGGRPCCIKCRRLMMRNRAQWFCYWCPGSYTRAHRVAAARYMAAAAGDRPWCIKCHHPMARNRNCFRCLNCPKMCAAKQRARAPVAAGNPYCLKCRRQMCSANPRPDRRGFQCTRCRQTVAAHSTHHGRVSGLPWCIFCRKPMRRARGTMLPGGGAAGAFKCGYCRAYTLENPVRYRPRANFRANLILRRVEEVLPATLPAEVRLEARSALYCDVLAGQLKLMELDNRRTVRRYVQRAYPSNYAAVSLDAPRPNGGTFADLLQG